jgi:hypothetical protein
MKDNVKTNLGWKPVVRIPENVPAATFIQGPDAQAFLAEYEGIAKEDYGNARVLRVLSYDKDAQLVRGSNPFAVVLVNQMIRDQGMRTATPADLERVLATEALPLRGQYEDSALALRTEDGANEYLARNVMAQVRARNAKMKFPAVIPLAGLDLITDGSSPHGIGFKLRDDAQIIYAPILNKQGNFEAVDAETGLPQKIGSGNRCHYSRTDGLSWLYLNRYLSLYSNSGNLANSGVDGRVVLIRGEAAGAKILETYATKQNANFAEIEAAAKARYESNLARIQTLRSELNLR